MSDNLHIADADLALYAMGALLQPEAAPIAAHLEGCAICRDELRRNTLALGVYAQTTPETPLPLGAKDRFLARLEATPQIRTDVSVPVAETDAGRSWRSLFGAGPAPWSFALAIALAVALVIVGVDDVKKRAEIGPLLQQAQRGALDSAQLAQLMDLLTSQHVKKVALHPGPVATAPEGRVAYEAHTGKLLLTASNLHPLPEGKTYELWILQPNGKKPLRAGTFTPDSGGYASMILADAPSGLDVQGFGVTIENAGGSETPTLPIVLSGT